MSEEDPKEDFDSGRSTDEELREILDAAERRKDAEWNDKGRKVSLFLAIPAAVFILWAAGFLIQYESSNQAPSSKPVVVVPTEEQMAAKEDLAAFDSFRPKPESGKPQGSVTIGGKVVDKSDVEFISQLLHFSEAADKPGSKH